jgi:hypothetical protein
LNCEVQTIGTGHTFVSDLFGDAGTFTGGATRIAETWTSGFDAGTTFSGKWDAATKSYVGKFGGTRSGVTGQLVKGDVASWDTASC